MRAVIVGGGLGGLATALRLNARGWRVTVCEAGATFGGKMNSWEEGGFRFDTGPSLVTMPDVFAELFSAAGERLEEHLKLVRVDPHAEYRFADGTRVICPSSTEEWREEVRRVEARDVQGFDRVHALGKKLYELSKRTFFKQSPRTRPKFSDLAALRHLPLWRGWGNYARTVGEFFRSPHLRQIYNRYPTYVGSSPFLCPATLLIIPFLEREFGAWYVRGGLYRVVESLVGLAQARGVELRSNAQVVFVERKGGRASGVRLQDGTHLPGDVVVINGDVATAGALLGKPAKAEDGRGRSLSGFVILQGVRSRPAGLAHHTVLFSSDYRREFEDLFTRQRFPEEPTIYISAPAANDPSVAPVGGDALFVMANAPSNGERWTVGHVESAARTVRGVLSRAGLSLDCGGVSDIFDPRRFARRYLAPGGAIYGRDSHGWKNAFFRPGNKSAEIGGLYFVGGSSHPGGGTPTVLMSARIVAEMIGSDARA